VEENNAEELVQLVNFEEG
jgi:hypothetical protein